jgi:hypothetical protein
MSDHQRVRQLKAQKRLAAAIAEMLAAVDYVNETPRPWRSNLHPSRTSSKMNSRALNTGLRDLRWLRMAKIEKGKWNAELSRSFPLQRAAARGLSGRVIGPEPKNQHEHFYKCPMCGQQVDRRQLGEVLHHQVLDHKPIPAS